MMKRLTEVKKNIKECVKEYWEVFRTNIYDQDAMAASMKRLDSALAIVAVFSSIMAVMNFFAGDYRMMFSSILLGGVFGGTCYLGSRLGKHAAAVGICMVSLLAVFTFYILTGGSHGFAALWTLMAPMFVMSCVGVKMGAMVGLYLQILLMVFFWTPLRVYVAEFYSSIFMNRFPLLFLCTLVVSLVVMLSNKKQQLELNAYQSKLEKAVQEEHNRATQIIFQTIGAIISLVDAKDPYTDDHSLRVAQYSLMIAEELGWSHEEAEKLYFTALLHDIGKVGVHDAILKKSSRLSDSEYQIMKTHTSIGATILKEMSFLDAVDEGALYHHEKYDGTGYPFGLKGEEIPQIARIICLADSFDAMNSARVYRAKCDEKYIMEEIKRCRGTQFDPEIVDAFLRCAEKNPTIFM